MPEQERERPRLVEVSVLVVVAVWGVFGLVAGVAALSDNDGDGVRLIGYGVVLLAATRAMWVTSTVDSWWGLLGLLVAASPVLPWLLDADWWAVSALPALILVWWLVDAVVQRYSTRSGTP